ncbi:MAG: sigma factor-like helix-turn-helix DNA-binding protein [Roseiarcus sp.]
MAEADHEDPPREATTRRVRSRALREANRERRSTLFELVLAGYTRGEIARRCGVSVRTVQREVERALDTERAETPRRYAELQLARLQRALPVVNAALERGDLEAVSKLALTLKEMDRYQGLAARFEAVDAEPPLLAAPHESPFAALIQALRPNRGDASDNIMSIDAIDIEDEDTAVDEA